MGWGGGGGQRGGRPSFYLILFDWAQTHGTGDLLDDREKDEKKGKDRMNVWEGMHWDDKRKKG